MSLSSTRSFFFVLRVFCFSPSLYCYALHRGTSISYVRSTEITIGLVALELTLLHVGPVLLEYR